MNIKWNDLSSLIMFVPWLAQLVNIIIKIPK